MIKKVAATNIMPEFKKGALAWLALRNIMDTAAIEPTI